MSLRYSANLSMLWADRPFVDRFDAAATAGFSNVEMLFPNLIPFDDLTAALDRNGLQMSLFDLHAGDWEAGERGIAALPDRVSQCRETWPRDIELANQLGTTTLTVLAGLRPEAMSAEACDDALVDNLVYLLSLSEASQITFTVEAINHIDVPGFHVRTVDHAAAIVDRVGSERVLVQFDQYHVAQEGASAPAAFDRHKDMVGHVQIADSPGRHEPGTGAAGVRRFLDRVAASDYRGRVGLEYAPSGDTDASLSWLPVDARSD